jgi:hypothetical protein
MLFRYIVLSCSWMLEDRWLSVGSDLKFDARRDLDDVGALPVEGKCSISSLRVFFFNYRPTN